MKKTKKIVGILVALLLMCSGMANAEEKSQIVPIITYHNFAEQLQVIDEQEADSTVDDEIANEGIEEEQPVEIGQEVEEILGEITAEEVIVEEEEAITEDLSTQKVDIYTVTAADFESQLIYLKNNGYTFITFEELYRKVRFDIDLPKKPILLIADDGYVSNYEIMYPLLKKHNAKATVALITSRVGNENIMNWEQMKEMTESGHVSIQMHTHSLHDPVIIGDKPYPALVTPDLYESKSEHKARIKADLELCKKLIEENTGGKVYGLVYPGGVSNEMVEEVLKEMGIYLGFYGFNYTFSDFNDTEEFNPYQIKRFNVDASVNGVNLYIKIDNVMKNTIKKDEVPMVELEEAEIVVDSGELIVDSEEGKEIDDGQLTMDDEGSFTA